MKNYTLQKSTKILIVTHKIPPQYSGVGERAVRHGEYLHKNNQLAYILTLTQKESYENQNYYLKRIPESKIIRIPQKKRFKSIPSSYLRIIDVFIAFINMVSILWFVLIFYKKNHKSISIVHSFTNHYFSLLNNFYSFAFQIPYIIESTMLGGDSGPSGKLAIFQEFIYRNAKRIICISKALKSEFIKHGFKKEQLSVVPNDVNTKLFFPVDQNKKNKIRSKLGISKDSTVLLFVGVVNHRKGIDIAYKVFKKLKGKIQNIELIVVGSLNAFRPNDKTLLQSIMLDIKVNKLTEITKFVGQTANVNLYFQASDYFIFPSRREGFGTVQIEAMATGIPVIAGLLPGITDYIIQDETDGFIIKDIDDYAGYAKKIIDLNGNFNQYNKISKAAVEKARTTFSQEAIMSIYDDIYKAILN